MPTLDWIGKKAVVNHHREVPYRLVHCDGELSAGDADAGNLLVQGDNLEALKALLPYYAGKVKCIYIDPPYNTGNEGWVYNDNVNSPEIKTWLGKVVGKEAEDLSRHDKWLCMMYPRLRLLKEFLREDGVIFISIDDDEQAYLRVLCDDIFGRSRFVASNIWQKRYAPDARLSISDAHEYVICYAKNPTAFKENRNLIPLTEAQTKQFRNPDKDDRGPWKADNFTAPGFRPNQMYEIALPSGRTVTPPDGRCWRVTKAGFEEFTKDQRMYYGPDGDGAPSVKRFLSEMPGMVPWTWWPHTEVGHSQEARNQIRDILGSTDIFNTPKPTRLVKRIMHIATEPGDIVMDSFAGSGTTGEAILELNKSEETNRKFILVEMDAKVAGSVAAARLDRVIRGYEKGGDKSKPVAGLGGGFRYCRLGVPLFNEFGDVDGGVSYPDLAAHVFFAECGAPIPSKANVSSNLLGTYQSKAVYLLFSASEPGFAREAAGNVLTPDALANLPVPSEDFDGERVIYAEGCTVGKERLVQAGVTFKQIPYQIEGA